MFYFSRHLACLAGNKNIYALIGLTAFKVSFSPDSVSVDSPKDPAEDYQ